jgi:hypothetical protein
VSDVSRIAYSCSLGMRITAFDQKRSGHLSVYICDRGTAANVIAKGRLVVFLVVNFNENTGNSISGFDSSPDINWI